MIPIMRGDKAQVTCSMVTHLPETLHKLICHADKFVIMVGWLFLGVYKGGSDDGIIDSLKKPEAGADPSEVIDTNRQNLETVLKNQLRMYSQINQQHQDAKTMMYRGFGVIITLMTALIGLVGVVVAL